MRYLLFISVLSVYVNASGTYSDCIRSIPSGVMSSEISSVGSFLVEANSKDVGTMLVYTSHGITKVDRQGKCSRENNSGNINTKIAEMIKNAQFGDCPGGERMSRSQRKVSEECLAGVESDKLEMVNACRGLSSEITQALRSIGLVLSDGQIPNGESIGSSATDGN